MSTTTSAVKAAPKAEPKAPTLKVGDRVTAFVHPRGNGGAPTAAAQVTRVNSDGTVNLWVFPDGDEALRQTGVTVYASQEAALDALREHYQMLPGHRTSEAGKHVAGTNPRTGDPWELHDTLDWVQAAYVS